MQDGPGADGWARLADRPPETHQPLVSNVATEMWTDPTTQEERRATYYKPITLVSDQLRDYTGGWPRVAGGIPFVAQGRSGEKAEIRWLTRPDGLFAWVQEHCDVMWSEKACKSGPNGTPRTPCTKSEIFQHIKDSSPQRYIGVSTLPHYPAMHGVFYPYHPPIDGVGPDELTGKLDEFVASMNPETEWDRLLLKALILTLLWGGEPGTRPAFIFTGPDRGVGKTATATAISELVGGAFTIRPKDETDSIIKRLLGDNGLGKRVVLIDNVKGKMSNQDFEGLLTARTIDGWRPHFGDFQRPNYLTWVITANTPTLGEDMTVRSVLINFGAKRHGKAWVSWAAKFVKEYAAHVIHDCLVLLRRAPIGKISDKNRDRFQDWQDWILCRVTDNPDELAELIAGRRPAMNADDEDAEEISTVIKSYVKAKGFDPNKHACKISQTEMMRLLVEKEMIGKEMGKRGVTTWLMNMRTSSGPLRSLYKKASDGERFWVWIPDGTTYEGEIPI